MRAMVLEAARTPLRAMEVETPVPGPGQVRVKVEACAVCRTDLHILDGELDKPKLPLIPGHQIVGRVDAVGPDLREAARPGAAPGATPPAVGDRVGVPWLGWSDGTCPYCLSGRENLCDQARFTGYDIDGGYAEYALADRRFAFPIPEGYPSVQAAPLLCAGLIGYRSLTMADGGEVLGVGQRLGLYGYGAAAHIVTQVARHQGRRVFAFTRPGDTTSQQFALHMGAEWAGDTAQRPPEPVDAAIIFAPAGDLVPAALRHLAKGGVVVCGGIHMSDIPSFPYEILWGERIVRSVANLTRRDGHEFLALAPQVPVRTEVREFGLEQANEALECLRRGKISGAAVLVMDRAAKGG
jgi:alcohol dehydrogenase, propanol-preferring